MKKFKELCQKAHIDFKKKVISLSIMFSILLLLSLSITFFYSFYLGIIAFLLSVSYIAFDFFSIKSKITQIVISKEIAFNSFYRYVITLIKNENVLYSSLQSSLEFVDEVLYEDVAQLIENIENDPSLEPFLQFMENFNDDNIKQLIILLYKTQESNYANEILSNIDETILELEDTAINKYINKEEKKLSKYYAFPIILSSIVMIIVSLFIFSLIGGSINV